GHHPAAQGSAGPRRAGRAGRQGRLRVRRGPPAARGRPDRRRRRVRLRDAAPAVPGRRADQLRGALRRRPAPQVLRAQRRRPGPAGPLRRGLALLRHRRRLAAATHPGDRV
ncbi:MAG: Transcriptional regulator, PadR family, partial [uncultured Corynebacteriales bacterium]